MRVCTLANRQHTQPHYCAHRHPHLTLPHSPPRVCGGWEDEASLALSSSTLVLQARRATTTSTAPASTTSSVPWSQTFKRTGPLTFETSHPTSKNRVRSAFALSVGSVGGGDPAKASREVARARCAGRRREGPEAARGRGGEARIFGGFLDLNFFEAAAGARFRGRQGRREGAWWAGAI